MAEKRQLIPAAGLVATVGAAAWMAAQLAAQAERPTRDLTNAVTAEVRDAQGQVVLRGQFQLADDEDDDVERHADLEPTGIDADAIGEAEVEFSKVAPAVQEVEFAARNLTPRTAFTFAIDGMDVAVATANSRGLVEIELDVRIPGTNGSR